MREVAEHFWKALIACKKRDYLLKLWEISIKETKYIVKKNIQAKGSLNILLCISLYCISLTNTFTRQTSVVVTRGVYYK